jgi:methylthioribose-1-phosphate isomerase
MARDPIPPTVEWRRGRVRLIDQRALPGRLRFVECATVDDVCGAIRSMVVRGAPALGATGAFGVALAARTVSTPRGVRAAARRIAGARPTEAERLAAEDVAANRALGAHGAGLVPDPGRVLTHCNTGSLAATQYGTALGVIRAAAEGGKRVSVWVDETRPVLQGARLTTWELRRLGIESRLVVDGMAGALMQAGEVDLVLVGADRIAANGDVANKIGTYGLAVLARHHHLPFVVAAPTSTIDLDTPSGESIPVEERPADEVVRIGGVSVAPAGVPVRNQAFDVTPARLVTAIVTEAGILRPPYRRSLRQAVRALVQNRAGAPP